MFIHVMWQEPLCILLHISDQTQGLDLLNVYKLVTTNSYNSLTNLHTLDHYKYITHKVFCLFSSHC
jgi:hypothetical protein